MERLFVDTSAWYAYVNLKDPQHTAVGESIQSFAGRLVTSNFIFDETVSLCRFRLSHHAATLVGTVLADPDAVDIIRVTSEDERMAWDLFCRRPDQHYSYTDCTSFVLMCRMGLTTALALDSDFVTEGFEVMPQS